MICIEITLLDLCAYTIYHRLVFLLFIPIRTTKISVFVSCILIDYIIKNTIYKILPNTPKFLINIEHYFKIKT